jgi:hypothetical protein
MWQPHHRAEQVRVQPVGDHDAAAGKDAAATQRAVLGKLIPEPWHVPPGQPSPERARLADGRRLTARDVVIATDGPAAEALLAGVATVPRPSGRRMKPARMVAFAAATGNMPLDMPESVLVRFKGDLKPGITLRDLVHAIP